MNQFLLIKNGNFNENKFILQIFQFKINQLI
jgi:hypothetical protein